PYTYRFMNGDSAFIPLQTLFFQVEDGKVQQVSASFSDWLPMDNKGKWLKAHSILFAFLTVFFLVSSLTLFIWTILKRRRNKPITVLGKWIGWLHASSAIMIINVFSLAARMLLDSTRAYSEVILHFGINYIFTFISLLSITMIIRYWRNSDKNQIQVIFYIMSIISSFLLIGLLVYWQ